MNQYPPAPLINTTKSKPPYKAVAFLFVVMVGSAVLGIRGLSDSSVSAAAQPGSVQAAPTQTPTPAPTSTPTPNRLLETADSYQVDEARARAEGAALQNVIMVESAKADELRKQELHNLALQATSTAIAAQVIAQSEAISITNAIAAQRGAVEVQALKDKESLYIGGRAFLIGSLFIGFLALLGLGLYVFITTWRQAGQAEQADVEVYEPPEPSKVEVIAGNQIRRPLAGSDITPEELALIAQAKQGRQITVRAVERLKMTSERFKVISQEMINAKYFLASGSERIRVFTTDEGEALLAMYAKEE